MATLCWEPQQLLFSFAFSPSISWEIYVLVISLGPLRSEPSTLVHWLTLRANCTVTNRQGHCTLAPLPSCTGLMPLETSANIPLQSTWNNIPAVICNSVSLDTFKVALKTQLINSVYMPRHWQWSISASDSFFCDIWHQLKKCILIDWSGYMFAPSNIFSCWKTDNTSWVNCICLKYVSQHRVVHIFVFHIYYYYYNCFTAFLDFVGDYPGGTA